MNTDNLEGRLAYDNFSREVKKNLDNYKSLKSKTNFLRLIKRRELLRTGIKDILGKYNLQETVGQISILAKVINDSLFEICFRETLDRHGVIEAPGYYCLMSLGKLGGNELNYSSDVDLFIIYEASSESIEPSNKNYFELLSEATALFVQKSTEITDAGYIYRVDFRLRPDGKTSPLCRTLRDTILYYETRGEDWERQMLIKLDFISGNKDLYNKFYEYISHYVYPASFSASPFEQIAKMKNTIEKREDAPSNIKLFSGGIRDIEFSAQALQLINGGKHPQLRTGNTLTAIGELRKLAILTEVEAETLTTAYIFYRRIEHYLQLMNDSQTHIIPSRGELLEKMSAYFNFASSEEFMSAIETSRAGVAKIFKSIVQTEAASDPLEVLQSIKFRDLERAKRNFNYLKTGENIFGHKQFDSKEINAFTSIQEKLLEELGKAGDPDLLLENFVKVIRSVSFASIWYREFERGHFFNAFLKICAASQKSIDMISTDKYCREMFLSGRVFIDDITDLFGELNINEINFYISVQFSLGLIAPHEASQILCAYIDKNITSGSRLLGDKYDYFIAGLGSYGSGEMNFNSDVDLIAAVSSIEDHPDVQNDFQNMLKEVSAILNPYKTDFRLRPEGKSGQLVWDVSAYKKYLHERAAIWEFQTLTKARFICGNKSLYDDFFSSAAAEVKKLDKAKIKSEIIAMRKRIEKEYGSSSLDYFNPKKSRGGLLEIEFPLQYFLLCDNELFRNYSGKNTRHIIRDLNASGLTNDDLQDNFDFIHRIIFSVQTIFNMTSGAAPSSAGKIKILASAFDMSEAEFKNKLSQVVQFNKDFFSNHLS